MFFSLLLAVDCSLTKVRPGKTFSNSEACLEIHFKERRNVFLFRLREAPPCPLLLLHVALQWCIECRAYLSDGKKFIYPP